MSKKTKRCRICKLPLHSDNVIGFCQRFNRCKRAYTNARRDLIRRAKIAAKREASQ